LISAKVAGSKTSRSKRKAPRATGPASGPLPTSSTPKRKRVFEGIRDFSKSKSGVINLVKNGFF